MDSETKTVLMLGYMNAYQKTVDSKSDFYSRSKKKDSGRRGGSGNFLNLIDIK
jgi:phosphoribosyl-AMP cyclohydrolase